MTNSNLPRACTKQVLYRYLKDIPEKEFRSIVNKIISQNRKLPFQIAKFKKNLRQNEVREVMEFFGYLEEV